MLKNIGENAASFLDKKKYVTLNMRKPQHKKSHI
jgi:hypothetical protein